MQGQHVHRSLRVLVPVLNELRGLFVETERAFPQDERFWFNECTLNGMLSVASWRCGLPSIVEAKTGRRAGTKASGAGHLDVLIAAGKRKLAIESKIRWYADPDGTHALLGKLETAWTEAAGLPPDAGTRLALAFGILERRSLEPRRLLEESLKIARTENLDVLSWHLDDTSTEAFRYPGYVLVGRLVA